MCITAALAALGLGAGCVHGGTGPVVGISEDGPSLGWEGSLGLGPIQATAGGLWRPLSERYQGALFVGAGPTVAAPVDGRGNDGRVFGAGGCF